MDSIAAVSGREVDDMLRCRRFFDIWRMHIGRPVGGAVGTVVGGTVGGVTGGVKGVLGVSDKPKRKPKKQTNN